MVPTFTQDETTTMRSDHIPERWEFSAVAAIAKRRADR
jgi:hypothetical protein